MAKVSLFVKFVAVPGRRDDVIAALEAVVPTAAQEEGTEVWTYHVDRGDDDAVWVFEVYADDDAFGAHSSSESLAGLLATLDGLLAEPPTMALTTPAGGTGLQI